VFALTELHIPPAMGVGLILVVFGLLMGALTIVKRTWSMHPEVPRKCTHVVMGLVALPIPWLFDSVVPVAVLGCLSFAFLMLLRFAARRNCELGNILHWSNERRASIGDLVFPIAILTMYCLANADPILYCLPLLYLTFSDPFACFVGMRFSRIESAKRGKQKTMEGSFAFFLATFAMTIGTLLGFTDIDAVTVILVALVAGAVLSVVEAISTKGADNITVPMFGYLVLSITLSLDTFQLIELVSLPALVACVFQLCRLWTGLMQPVVTVKRHTPSAFTVPSSIGDHGSS